MSGYIRSDGKIYSGTKYIFDQQDSINDARTPPVTNTWYTVLDVDDCELINIAVYQSNDEVAAKNIDVRITCNGVVWFGETAQANGTYYYHYKERAASGGGAAGLLATIDIALLNYYNPMYGSHIKVEVRNASAAGTSQTLYTRIQYSLLVVT